MDVYTVTATIQAPDNDPVDMKWSRSTNPMNAIVAVGQLITHHTEVLGSLPESVRPRTLSIRIDITHEEIS